MKYRVLGVSCYVPRKSQTIGVYSTLFEAEKRLNEVRSLLALRAIKGWARLWIEVR